MQNRKGAIILAISLFAGLQFSKIYVPEGFERPIFYKLKVYELKCKFKILIYCKILSSLEWNFWAILLVNTFLNKFTLCYLNFFIKQKAKASALLNYGTEPANFKHLIRGLVSLNKKIDPLVNVCDALFI